MKSFLTSPRTVSGAATRFGVVGATGVAEPSLPPTFAPGYAPARVPSFRSPVMSRIPESPRIESDASRTADPRRGKKRVLVVDDEKDLVDMIGYNLQRNGYDVLTA